jgi:hypothetical protein
MKSLLRIKEEMNGKAKLMIEMIRDERKLWEMRTQMMIIEDIRMMKRAKKKTKKEERTHREDMIISKRKKTKQSFWSQDLSPS